MKIILILISFVILGANSFEVTNDKYFFSYPFKANWFRAVEACRFKNMDIVSVDNSDKLKEIHEFVTNTEANINYNTWANQIWTGGNDLAKEGDYGWISNGRRIPKYLWQGKVDNNIFMHGMCTDEDCLALIENSKKEFQLNDFYCKASRYFLCEKSDEDVVTDVSLFSRMLD